MKSLYLAPLFQNEDWEGLSEILSAINETTKRAELPALIEALQEKRKRIEEFQSDATNKLNRLEQRENQLQQLEDETNRLMDKVRQETKFLSKYPQHVHDFLVRHLGIYGDKLVLARRLDSRWQKALKKNGIVSYSAMQYVWFVDDLDALVEEYESRTNRKKPYPTEWDYNLEEKRSHEWDVPVNPEYKLPTGLAADLLLSINDIEKKKQEVETERKNIQQEIKQLRKSSPKSFIEQVEASNTLSVHDIKKHGEMVNKALKWLSTQGYIVCSEITLPNGKRADVIGYDETEHIIIIEVKVSRSDFLQDHKWQTYLDYCDTFYFFTDQSIRPLIQMKKDYQGIGLLQEKGNSLHVEYPHEIKHVAQERKSITFSINKTLSRKFVYGY